MIIHMLFYCSSSYTLFINKIMERLSLGKSFLCGYRHIHILTKGAMVPSAYRIVPGEGECEANIQREGKVRDATIGSSGILGYNLCVPSCCLGFCPS